MLTFVSFKIAITAILQNVSTTGNMNLTSSTHDSRVSYGYIR